MDDFRRSLLALYVLGGVVIGIGLGSWIVGDGYQNGQIDAINGTWKYQKVTTSDGAVHYLAVATQPAK